LYDTTGGNMAEETAELLITLMMDQNDPEELDKLTHQLRSEIKELSIDSIGDVSLGKPPDGTKSLDLVSVGQMVVTLAPTVIPPLFALVKSWVERKPSTPVKIKIKVGGRTAQVEYDPTKTTGEELNSLVRTMGRAMKR
jgi:hypothetical protein